jgi:hypothetical protein
MQPGFRTHARARRSDALDTLFADETATAPPQTPEAPKAALTITELDLKLFAEEPAWQPKRSRRLKPVALLGSSPYVVVTVVALFTIAAPLFLSQQFEQRPSGPVTVVAKQSSEVVAAPIPDQPVATTAEEIVAPPASPPSRPVAPPAGRSAPPRAPSKQVATKAVPPPPVRETTRASLTSTTSTPRAPIATPVPQPQPVAIPALPTNSRPVETLGTLPVSLVAPPAPPPAAADSRPRGPAPETVDERGAVLATLRRYEAAYSALDAGAVRTVWPTVNQAALSRAFESLAEQKIKLGNCMVTVRAPTARAICTGTATWVPRIGGGRPREDRRTWNFSLAQRDQSWSIVSAETR